MENGAEFYFRFLDGDKEGMTDLIREYKDGLSLYINSFVKNICQAEELMEETFVSLVMKKPKYSGKSSFKTWLYAIGRNIAFDYIRKSKRHRNDLPIDELYEMSDEENIENSYIQEEQKKRSTMPSANCIPITVRFSTLPILKASPIRKLLALCIKPTGK